MAKRGRKPVAQPDPTKRADDQGINWDELPRAERNIRWCEAYLNVPEGQFVGKPLTIAEFMREDFRAIYGNPNGTRRAIISRGRKNSKTTECALILLLHLCGPEARPNSSLFSAAQSRDQAALIFNLACKMIRMSPMLRELVSIKDAAKIIIDQGMGTTYRALSAESTTAFGLSPSLVLHDELGQVKGPRSGLYEALETATAAQAEPLSIIISTQASADNDLLSILIDDAKAQHDPHTVLRLNCAPDELDAFSDEAIRAANPAFDVFMNRDEVRAMAKDAKRMPARQSEFENLVLNRRVETNSPFIQPSVWKACGAPVAGLHRVPIFAGLDLSSVSDLTALVMIGKVDKTWHVKPTFWLPEQGLAEKAKADRVPYDLWASQGFLRTTPGATVSYEYVAQQLADLMNEYDFQKIAFDRWSMKHFIPWLVKAGVSEITIQAKFMEFGQGTASMTAPLHDLEQLVRDQHIAHGDHPVLAMNAMCAVIEGNDSARKLSKNRSNGRIDGLVALAMAVGAAAPLLKPVDVYAMIG